jgi:hypothetical protein
MRKYLLLGVFILLLASCGPAVIGPPSATPAPLTLPATWTPTTGPTARPTTTEFPTFTPVPVITIPYPTSDPLSALRQRFEDDLVSPDGHWTANREGTKLIIRNKENPLKTWTLPCELFEECSTVYPLLWSDDSTVLYFAPAPTVGGAGHEILSITAFAMIDIRTGKWTLLLPDSNRYYDFMFAPDYKFMAFTQSSAVDSDEPYVTVGILRMKNGKVENEHNLTDEIYAGNIVWSPFKRRIVFQTQNPDTGSSVVFFDMETGVLKYIVDHEQSDLFLSTWNDADNTVLLEKRDWVTHARSYWLLNPFTGDQTPASAVPTPRP